MMQPEAPKAAQPKVQAPKPAPEPRRPDDRGSIQVDGFVKIFDPNTQQVFLETRA